MESRNINAIVWILENSQILERMKDRSLGQKRLLGHSLMENSDALLPWADL